MAVVEGTGGGGGPAPVGRYTYSPDTVVYNPYTQQYQTWNQPVTAPNNSGLLVLGLGPVLLLVLAGAK